MKITEETLQKIKAALQGFGVRKGAVRIVRHDCFAADVYVSGVHFGLWDLPKNTFVE